MDCGRATETWTNLLLRHEFTFFMLGHSRDLHSLGWCWLNMVLLGLLIWRSSIFWLKIGKSSILRYLFGVQSRVFRLSTRCMCTCTNTSFEWAWSWVTNLTRSKRVVSRISYQLLSLFTLKRHCNILIAVIIFGIVWWSLRPGYRSALCNLIWILLFFNRALFDSLFR